jgi:hypothetical protein
MTEVLGFMVPLLGTIVTLATIAWGIWVFNKTRRERTSQMVELQTKMLERFANSQEFVGFLQSSSGQQYLRWLTEVPRKSPKLKIIRSVQTGVVLMILGTCLIGLSFLVGFSRPTEEGPFIIGFLSFFLGAGFVASAAISYIMSKKWHLFSEESERPASQSPS